MLTLNGHQLVSRYAPVREADIQASLIPEGAEEAWCYGVGNGELVRACLRRGVKRLHVVRMNQEAIDAADLSGTDIPGRVCFTEPLAASVKTLRVPFACSPVEVMHADPDAWHLRDRIRAVLNEEYNGRRLSKLAEAKWDGHRKLNAELCDPSVTELFHRTKAGTAVVCGAGPTLSSAYGFIRRNPTATIIAASSALKPLEAVQIYPETICLIDEMADMVAHVEGAYSSAPLAYRISVNPAVPRSWRGRRYVIGDDDLFRGGSVIHVAVDLAVKMGAHTVYLAGCDFGYPKMESHVDGAAKTGTPGLLEYWNGFGEILRTDENLCQYRVHLEEYIRMHPEVKFYKLGRAGADVAGAEWVDA